MKATRMHRSQGAMLLRDFMDTPPACPLRKAWRDVQLSAVTSIAELQSQCSRKAARVGARRLG